jgi:hypothetical protein
LHTTVLPLTWHEPFEALVPITSSCALIGSRTSIWIGTDEFVPTASE